MPKFVTMLIGLPGSGKTYYLAHNHFDAVFDDCAKDQTLADKLLAIQSPCKIALADPRFCIDKTRENIVQFLLSAGYVVDSIFWENNLIAAEKNVYLRKDRRDISRDYLRFLSNNYNPPEGSRKIYDGSENDSKTAAG